jgi:hypothetical protein
LETQKSGVGKRVGCPLKQIKDEIKSGMAGGAITGLSTPESGFTYSILYVCTRARDEVPRTDSMSITSEWKTITTVMVPQNCSTWEEALGALGVSTQKGSLQQYMGNIICPKRNINILLAS